MIHLPIEKAMLDFGLLDNVCVEVGLVVLDTVICAKSLQFLDTSFVIKYSLSLFSFIVIRTNSLSLPWLFIYLWVSDWVTEWRTKHTKWEGPKCLKCAGVNNKSRCIITVFFLKYIYFYYRIKVLTYSTKYIIIIISSSL